MITSSSMKLRYLNPYLTCLHNHQNCFTGLKHTCSHFVSHLPVTLTVWNSHISENLCLHLLTFRFVRHKKKNTWHSWLIIWQKMSTMCMKAWTYLCSGSLALLSLVLQHVPNEQRCVAANKAAFCALEGCIVRQYLQACWGCYCILEYLHRVSPWNWQGHVKLLWSILVNRSSCSLFLH